MNKIGILIAAAFSVANSIDLQSESMVGAASCTGDMEWCNDQVVIQGCNKSIYHPNLQYELRLDCDGELWLKKHENHFCLNMWKAPVWSHKKPDRLVM